jgi:taurine dioxygenase
VQDYGAYFAGNAHVAARRRIEDIPKDQLQMAVHPVVLKHPRTGELLLYVNEQHARNIVELPEDESDELMDDLRERIRRPDNVYAHTWRVGDLIIWDNLALLHARTPWPKGEPRTLRRIQLQ